MQRKNNMNKFRKNMFAKQNNDIPPLSTYPKGSHYRKMKLNWLIYKITTLNQLVKCIEKSGTYEDIQTIEFPELLQSIKILEFLTKTIHGTFTHPLKRYTVLLRSIYQIAACWKQGNSFYFIPHSRKIAPVSRMEVRVMADDLRKTASSTIGELQHEISDL